MTAEGWDDEATLLIHAQSKGVTDGLVQIQDVEYVKYDDNGDNLDSTLHNRRVDDSQRKYSDRIHMRLIFRYSGSTVTLLRFRIIRSF